MNRRISDLCREFQLTSNIFQFLASCYWFMEYFCDFLYSVNDDNCVDGDGDSSDNDTTKNEKCKMKAQI